MKYFYFLLVIPFILSSLYAEQPNQTKDIHYYINKAWEHSSQVKQAEYEVKKYKNLQLEVISIFTPKINTMTYIAPIFTREGTSTSVETPVNLNQWGPHYKIDMQFQQPIFAFTRVVSGIKAAREGIKVAEADVELTKWDLAKNIRLYYYGIIFANTMTKTLNMAEDMMLNALETAEEAMANGDASVSEVELSQLKYFYTKIPINRSFIEKSVEQAQLALTLETGEKLLPEDIPARLEMELEELQELDFYMNLMFKHRPLLKKLDHGIEATRQLMLVEFKAFLPVLFMGGFFRYNVTPTFPAPQSVLQQDTFNTIDNKPVGGAAFGFLWQLDPMKYAARGLQKKADYDKLLELRSYAEEGFPIQLIKTYTDLKDLQVKIQYQGDAVENAQNWMFFAANAFILGTGEAKDIMEGLAAYVDAKTAYYQAIYDYNKMLGELCEICGIDITLLKDEQKKTQD